MVEYLKNNLIVEEKNNLEIKENNREHEDINELNKNDYKMQEKNNQIQNNPENFIKEEKKEIEIVPQKTQIISSKNITKESNRLFKN